MAGIVGSANAENLKQVEIMLERIAHRGPVLQEVYEVEGTAMGIAWTEAQAMYWKGQKNDFLVEDAACDNRLASAEVVKGKLVIRRDRLGVAPLYYGESADGQFYFASEVKALLEATENIQELPPGSLHDGSRVIKWFTQKKVSPLDDSVESIAAELRTRLETAVQKRIRGDVVGCWLSGGLDSSTLAAIARPFVRTLHTFASGVKGSEDLERAREVSRYIESEHHEVVVDLEDMLQVLPDVIYHLESFDALLVRSSITNYWVAKIASDYVADVFSGEGGDEIFAGYEYLKDIELEQLPDELLEITARLHNTALQRVDRSAAAHGILAYVSFLAPEVLNYALRIPVELKLRDGVEKWILRKAVADTLPDRVLNRKKAKFWEGAGVGEQLHHFAEEHISDSDFQTERNLSCGWRLRTKEELLYYRIFNDHFGDLPDLSWMGRTKGAPVQ